MAAERLGPVDNPLDSRGAAAVRPGMASTRLTGIRRGLSAAALRGVVILLLPAAVLGGCVGGGLAGIRACLRCWRELWREAGHGA